MSEQFPDPGPPTFSGRLYVANSKDFAWGFRKNEARPPDWVLWMRDAKGEDTATMPEVLQALRVADEHYRGLIETSGVPVSGAPYCYEFRTRLSRESVVDALAWLRKRGLVREHPARNGQGPIVELRSRP